jgi:asparagine synthetase B (glutamine-hydrolysing)
VRDTTFPKQIKFAGTSDAKELHVESIWLSPEGFDEILFGMKLPDEKGQLKITRSAFLRALERITSSKNNGVILFENLEVLSEAQRDRLAEFLSDLEDGVWEIEGKKFTIPENLKIVVKIRSKLMLKSWKYAKQIPLRTLKLVEIPKK